jgi:hypothetical protein
LTRTQQKEKKKNHIFMLEMQKKGFRAVKEPTQASVLNETPQTNQLAAHLKPGLAPIINSFPRYLPTIR